MKTIDRLRTNNTAGAGTGNLLASIRAIFSNRDGAVYEYTKSNLNQLSTGATPVAIVTDPVGLALDSHLGISASTKGAYMRIFGSHLDSPDRASNRPTGDFTWVGKFAADDFTPAALQVIYLDGASTSTSVQNINIFVNADGTITMNRPSAGTARTFISTVALSTIFANYATAVLKIYFQQNIAGVSQTTFSYSLDDGVSFTQLGAVVTNANTGAGNANTTGIHIGATQVPTFQFAGKIYYTKLYDAAGVLVTNYNGTDYPITGGTTVTSSTTGEVYTLQGSAYIAPDGNHALQATAAARPFYSKRVNLLVATSVLSTQNVTTKAIPYTLSFTGSGTVTLSGTSTAGPLVGGGTLTFTPTAGTLTLTVTGSVTLAQLEYGTSATRYQAVVTATNFDEAGFPPYIETDGIDDHFDTATGGGGSAGFFYCESFRPLMAAATIRTLYSDAGTNTGYKVEIDATGKVSFSAGNGVAYTTITSIGSVSPGNKTWCSVWDDGVNLNVKLDGEAVQSVARPVVVAGTTYFTLGKENDVAAKYRAAQSFGVVYSKNTGGTASERALEESWVRSIAGI